MSIEDELRAEITALRARVAELEQRTIGEIRLGPRRETQADVDARTQRLVDAVKAAVPHEHETDPNGRQICTTSGDAPSKVRAEQTEATGQHKSYIVLCEDERKKGFVRPYRDAYKHVGPFVERCEATTQADGEENPHQCVRPYPHGGEHEFNALMILNGPIRFMAGGRRGGCGSITTMGQALSETYARDPTFYGATFCGRCNKHLPVAEFVWTADSQVVGS